MGSKAEQDYKLSDLELEEVEKDEAFSRGHNIAELNPPKPKKPRPRSKFNILSYFFLLWVDSIFWTGCHRPLKQSDLFAHPSEADSEKLLRRFNRHWKTELERKKFGKKPRLLVAVLKCLWLRLTILGAMIFLESAIQVGQSVVLGVLANSFNEEDTASSSMGGNSSSFSDFNQTGQSNTDPYFYATGISLMSFAATFVHAHTFLLAYKIGMNSRIILTAAIYQKVLSLSQVQVGQISIGHIVNLASNDVQRFDLAFLFCHIMWIAPIHLAVVTYLVYLEVGWSSFVMTAFICFQVPLQIFMARFFAHLRFKSAKLTDKRIRIMNEVITGIRVIKMYAWEYAFKKIVTKLRKQESRLILQAGFVRAASLGFMMVSLTMIMYIVFVSYTATGGRLTPKKVFTTLSLLIYLRLTTVHFLIQNVLSIVEGRVAIVRLQKLFEMEELKFQQEAKPLGEGEASVAARGLSASWADDKTKLTLNDISFSVNKDHRLLAVVGPVGSGKSTLLQCLLDELKPVEGDIEVNGKISYAAQEPWIFSATLRENVIFGKPFNREFYDKVIKACALDKDIELLKNGDLTLVGERGVTLSGGQKARVNLARAVYHDSDIYLLDDPLSAVDTAVGKHLFEECICGLLKDRLVILVTHQVHLALLANKILVMKEGCVEAYGSHIDLLTEGLDPEHLLGLISPKKTEEESERGIFSYKNLPKIDKEKKSVSKDGALSPTMRLHHRQHPKSPLLALKGYHHLNPPSPRQQRTPRLHRKHQGFPLDQLDISPFDTASIYSYPSMHSIHTAADAADIAADTVSIESEVTLENENEKSYDIQPPEETVQGTLSTKTYYNYFRAGGSILFIILVFLFLLFGEAGIVLSDWWIADWAACDANGDNMSSICSLRDSTRIYIYTGLSFYAISMSFLRTFCFYFICVNASRVLHNRMFRSLLRVPVLFFDTNPIGRILNRFSKDVGFLDDLLPYIFCEYMLLGFRCLAIISTALAANWWIFIPAGVLLVGLVLIRWYFLKTSREVKRLEAVARSPVFSHLSTTLQGLSTIRSFRNQSTATQHFHNFQNQHTQGWYIYLVTTRWFGMRIDTLGSLFITAISFISVGLLSYVSDRSLIGLSLTYAVSLTGMFQYTVRQSAEVENLMISSERVMEYSRLEPEASLETLPPNQKPPEDWPTKGELQMESVSFQYSPELPLVLKNLSFSVRASEKVGIVGRTGAGKSSLLSVLYRLAEPYGQITIDGVDTKSIGLHDLRKKMSIIPQDPVLFSGTMRYNLDPFDEYSDAKLWEVLELVQLKPAVEEFEGRLSGEVSEGGSNFSVGQRQLVCLARALLRKSKILILDEATANVDPKTDEIIQATIRENFGECTVMTIAHRLNTIMDSDRILVMSDGEVIEFDTPLSLLQNKTSQFYRMVAKTGPDASHKLYQMAVEADRRRDTESIRIQVYSESPTFITSC